MRKTLIPSRDKTPARLTESQAAALVRAEEARLKARELELAHQFRVEQLEAERATWRATQAVQTRRTRMDHWWTTWSSRLDRWSGVWSNLVRRAVPLTPLVLTNAMAVMGQAGWGRHNLDQIGATANSPARWAIAILFAATLESLALFQGYYASKALERRDSAAGLYLGAFATAAVVAGLNYSHFASTEDTVTVINWDVPAPTAMAVVFALFSFISPALWRIHSRAVNRDKLKAAGEMDTRAVKLSMARKLWHPIKSFKVMYHATWAGVEDPGQAVELFEARQATKAARKAAKKAKDDGTPEEAPGGKVPARVEEVAAVPLIARRFPEAWQKYGESVAAGRPLSQRQLAADHLGGNRHHARDLIKAWKGVSNDGDDAVRTAPASA